MKGAIDLSQLVPISGRISAIEYVDAGKARRLRKAGLAVKGDRFRHDFTRSNARIYGTKDGKTLVIR